MAVFTLLLLVHRACALLIGFTSLSKTGRLELHLIHWPSKPLFTAWFNTLFIALLFHTPICGIYTEKYFFCGVSVVTELIFVVKAHLILKFICLCIYIYFQFD